MLSDDMEESRGNLDVRGGEPEESIECITENIILLDDRRTEDAAQHALHPYLDHNATAGVDGVPLISGGGLGRLERSNRIGGMRHGKHHQHVISHRLHDTPVGGCGPERDQLKVPRAA